MGRRGLDLDHVIINATSCRIFVVSLGKPNKKKKDGGLQLDVCIKGGINVDHLNFINRSPKNNSLFRAFFCEGKNIRSKNFPRKKKTLEA